MKTQIRGRSDCDSDFAGDFHVLLYDDLWTILMKTQITNRCDCDFAGDFHILLLDDLWKILMKIHIRGRCDPKHYIAGDFHFFYMTARYVKLATSIIIEEPFW